MIKCDFSKSLRYHFCGVALPLLRCCVTTSAVLRYHFCGDRCCFASILLRRCVTTSAVLRYHLGGVFCVTTSAVLRYHLGGVFCVTTSAVLRNHLGGVFCVTTSAVLRNAILCLIFPLFIFYVYIITGNGAAVAYDLGIAGYKRFAVFLLGGLKMV